MEAISMPQITRGNWKFASFCKQQQSCRLLLIETNTCTIANKGKLYYCKQRKVVLLQTKESCTIANKGKLYYCKQRKVVLSQTKEICTIANKGKLYYRKQRKVVLSQTKEICTIANKGKLYYRKQRKVRGHIHAPVQSITRTCMRNKQNRNKDMFEQLSVTSHYGAVSVCCEKYVFSSIFSILSLLFVTKFSSLSSAALNLYEDTRDLPQNFFWLSFFIFDGNISSAAQLW